MADADWKYLQYNVETGQKRTHDGPDAGPSSLADLDDTNISNPSDGQMLSYDATEGKWKNTAAPEGSVTDVQVDGQSVVNAQGVAEIQMPSVPVQDVQVDGTSVVNAQGVAEIQMPTPPSPDYPVTDVKVNGSSVVNNKQALITSYKEVTQAQYEALPDTKLNDGVLYAIKDGGEAVEGFPPLIYSLQEREVGVWTDGKPLYQKSYEFSGKSISANSQTSILSNLTGITVVSMHGYMHEGNNRFELGEAGLRLKLDTSTNILLIESKSGSSWSNIYGTVTLWYTKNSETAGSGTWNQQGAIAHHYSTDEKVIGTWIDGKPIYEKTFDFGQNIEFASATWVNTPVQRGNIKKIINGILLERGDNVTMYQCELINADSSYEYLRIYNTRSMKIVVGMMVLQYTKTTD